MWGTTTEFVLWAVARSICTSGGSSPQSFVSPATASCSAQRAWKKLHMGIKLWKFQIFFFGWLLWVLLKQKAKCQVILRFAPNRDPYLAECHSLWCRWLLTSFHKEGWCCGVCKLTKNQNKNNKKKYNIKSVVLHGRGHYTAVTLQLNWLQYVLARFKPARLDASSGIKKSSMQAVKTFWGNQQTQGYSFPLISVQQELSCSQDPYSYYCSLFPN